MDGWKRNMIWSQMPSYLDAVERARFKIARELRGVELEKAKRYLQARETEEKIPKHAANVRE